MSFQAYLDNIRAKTGLTPEQFRDAAQRRGLLGPDVRATQFTDWLAADHDLGLGHARALWEHFKRQGWVGAAASAPKAKPATKPAAKLATKPAAKRAKR